MKERIMPTLLHLDASARRGSFSRELGRVFAEEWQLAHPDGKYIYRDLGSQPAPFLDEARTEIAEYAAIHGIRKSISDSILCALICSVYSVAGK
jgi:FMN-dependent NADH-azoreductase